MLQDNHNAPRQAGGETTSSTDIGQTAKDLAPFGATTNATSTRAHTHCETNIMPLTWGQAEPLLVPGRHRSIRQGSGTLRRTEHTHLCYHNLPPRTNRRGQPTSRKVSVKLPKSSLQEISTPGLPEGRFTKPSPRITFLSCCVR